MAKENLNWCSEAEAAKLLGYQVDSLRIFTRNEKRKKLPIRTSKLNHSKILYSKTDIDKYIASKTA